MKRILCLPAALFLIITSVGCVCPQRRGDVLFQTSTIDTLLDGVFDGEMTVGELKRQGDFGIGTFNSLDGEMIGLDGKFYQIKSDGKAYSAGDMMKTPFAAVTFFGADTSLIVDIVEGYEWLERCLDSLLPTENIFYAVRIDGEFEYIKTRSVPRQNRPYPPLVEAVKNQPVFEFFDVKGTIAGFRCPVYVEGINVPGYHFHFITADKKAGGHLLDCRLHNVSVEVDYTSGFYLTLPESYEFYKTDLGRERQKELEKVEK